MRLLANASWNRVALIAAGWILAWLVAGIIGTFRSVDSFAGRAADGSGGLAAVGFSMNYLGAVIIFGPPLALLLLRLLAARSNSP